MTELTVALSLGLVTWSVAGPLVAGVIVLGFGLILFGLQVWADANSRRS